jgi:multiple sugar transport system permease protein
MARREAAWFYLLITPWAIGFLLFLAGPIIASSILSFTHNDPVNWPPTWVGLENYQFLVRDALFYQALKVTITFTLVSVPLSVVVATVIAMLLNQKIPLVSMWRTIYYLPAITSGVAVALMWSWIFQAQFGLLNGTLYTVTQFLFGPDHGLQGPRWLTDEHWAMPAFIIISLWQFGGPMLIYLAAIQNVPTALYEAAELDGAGVFRKIWSVTLPVITPVIFFNLIMNIIASFQVFTNAYIITSGGPHRATFFYVLLIYQNAFTYISNMGYADALSWVLFMVMLVFTALAFKSAQFWVFYEAPGEGPAK